MKVVDLAQAPFLFLHLSAHFLQLHRLESIGDWLDFVAEVHVLVLCGLHTYGFRYCVEDFRAGVVVGQHLLLQEFIFQCLWALVVLRLPTALTLGPNARLRCHFYRFVKEVLLICDGVRPLLLWQAVVLSGLTLIIEWTLLEVFGQGRRHLLEFDLLLVRKDALLLQLAALARLPHLRFLHFYCPSFDALLLLVR